MPGFGRFGRPSKSITIAISTVILLITGWVVFWRLSEKFSDRYESFYPSLAEATKDGAVDRGWIPDDILPGSSRNIHELHDLSPSREWCGFEFTASDSEKLRRNVNRIEAPSVDDIRDPDVSWWPASLKGHLDMAKIHGSGFEVYEVQRPANAVMRDVMVFAIDWSNGQGFFYSTLKSNK